MTIMDNDDIGYDILKREKNEDQKMEQERIKRNNPTLLLPVRDNPEEHLDILDEENVGEILVGVDPSAWELVLEKLGHMESMSTNHLLKVKTMEALWEMHGAET